MKNPKVKPREYQQECLVAIDDAIANGEKRVLVVMASSLGKTYTSAFAVEKYLADRRFARVLVLCHSEKILRQTKKKFQKYFGEEFSYGMYINDDKTTRPTTFLFATFQTMKENRKDFPKDEFAYVIVDEAHHSKARTFFPTIRYFQPEFLLGLTATPERLDGQKIEEIYGEPVYELGFVEATHRGLIAECDYRLILDDLSQERLDEYLKSDEKLSITQLNRTLFMPKRDEEIVRLIGEYSAEVRNPKTMIFCRTIEHARKIAGLMGDKAVLVHKKNSNSMNDYALKAFEDGEVNTIISVDMLNEGVDIPDANIVVFLRNTVSPAVFYQQLGRGTRLAEGKDKVLVLDFVKNCERIKMVLELKQEIDDFRIETPVKKTSTHGDGDANSREKFTLNAITQFNTELVDIVGMLEKVEHEWTKDEVMEELQDMHRRGEAITRRSIDANQGLPSFTTIRRMFGGKGLDDILMMAGIPTHRKRKVCLGREDLVVEGKAMLSRGEKITSVSIKANPKLPNLSVIIKKFGSCAKFAFACGQGDTLKDYGRDGLMEQYWLSSKKAGHWLTCTEVDEDPNLASHYTYKHIFGSHKNIAIEVEKKYGPLLTEAEEAMQCERLFRETREALAKQYFDASCRLCHWLRSYECGPKNGTPSAEKYYQYFDRSIANVIRFTQAIHGDLPETEEVSRQEHSASRSDKTLIEEYWGESRKNKHWLLDKEIKTNKKLASPQTYRSRFGSIKQVRQLAIETYGDFTRENTGTTN